MTAMRILLILCAVAILATGAFGQQKPAASTEPVLDLNSMDQTIDPCVDFFAYSCGGWIKKNPIPPDQSSWDTYAKMQDQNREELRGILEAASSPTASRDATTQKIGDYYASCMDEKAIEAKGTQPLQPELDRINKINSKAELADAAAGLVYDNVLFTFESIQDYRDANQVIANADQGALGFPIAIII